MDISAQQHGKKSDRGKMYLVKFQAFLQKTKAPRVRLPSSAGCKSQEEGQAM